MGPPRADGSNTSHRHLHQCPWSFSILKNQSDLFPSARVSILALWLPPPSYFVSNTHHVAFPMASSRKRATASPLGPPTRRGRRRPRQSDHPPPLRGLLLPCLPPPRMPTTSPGGCPEHLGPAAEPEGYPRRPRGYPSGS